MNTYDAQIIADSLSPDGVRLTTFQVTMPRFILAEFNTHRDKSRNSASSRAQPTEKLIERVRENPFVPLTFNKRVKGMGVGEAFTEADAAIAKTIWQDGVDAALDVAERLNALGLDKSRANRVMEPYMWHTIVCTATEWKHFFGLRNHPGAQPEFQIVAEMMEELYYGSDPQKLEYGWWHLPYLNDDELAHICTLREDHAPVILEEALASYKLISVRRCARVSWDKAGESEPPQEAMAKAVMLKTNGHASPFEHVARPIDDGDATDEERSYKLLVPMGVMSEWHQQANRAHNDWWDYIEPAKIRCGNFRGWWQFRAEVPNEDRFDLIARAPVSL